jgi:hypothetical protein
LSEKAYGWDLSGKLDNNLLCSLTPTQIKVKGEDLQSVEDIPKGEIIDLLNKCWMTYDGTWFFHCLQEFGIEVTNKLNKSAIKSLSAIEIERVKKTIGLSGRINSYNEFKMFFTEASKLMIPEFMNVTFDYQDNNKVTWRFNQGKCFAYLGIKKLGAIENYDCGVLYRIINVGLTL